MKYPLTQFKRITGKATGKSLYEVWRVRGPQDMTLVGYISRVEGSGWECDVATPRGQRIRRDHYLAKAKEYAKEFLA